MSYPGYPHYNQGAPVGYPPAQPGYPPAHGGPPQPGYPPAHGGPPQPGYPSAQPGYPPAQPGYPPASGAHTGYPPAPGAHTGYPPAPASQPGYPPSQPGYPPSQPGYPPSQPGYPPSQPGYPPSQPGYPPAQPGYPPSQPGYPPAQSGGYPPGQPGYPPAQSSGYPPGQSGYPPAGSGYPPHSAPPHSSAYPSLSAHHQSPLQSGKSSSSYKAKGNPTLRPAQPFNPTSDAEVLRKAMKGFGTDEKAIIKVLAYRSNAQRQEIAREFKTLYGKDLIKDLKSELSGKFEDLVVALMTPIPVFLARELHHAMAGVGTTEETLIEILCTASNEEIHAITHAYGMEYNSNLESDLSGETSGHFKRLLVSLSQGNRDENYGVDHHAATEDAKKLLKAGELQFGTDESTFNAILCSRSYAQLAEIFSKYYEITGHELDEAIENEFSGDIKEGLIAIFKCVLNKPGYFAQKLRQSMEGLGTHDRALIRIVSVRCENDMQDIKNVYQQMFGKPLEADIENDCSGDYKKCLLALVSS